MKTFKEYMMEQATTKYVAVQYDEATQRKLRDWAKKNGFDLTAKYDGSPQKEEDFDFHTTIFFTTSVHDLENRMITLAPGGEAKVVDITMLGDRIPVLKVESPMIARLRKHYEEVHGMKDQYPEYIAHVSLSYSKKLPDMSNIKLPDFPLTFNQVKIDDAAA